MAKYITVKEAATLADRNRQSIRNAINDKRIRSKVVNAPGIRGGKLTLVLASDVERVIWRRKDNNSPRSEELS